MRVFTSLAEFEASVGEHWGYSEWQQITQAQIDLFAQATGDHQWIHTDPVRAAGGPFGGTIAHGFLTLSLVPSLIANLVEVQGLAMRVNYGCDRVRFPAPVLCDSLVRAGAELISVERVANGARAVTRVTVECQGATKPVCVADLVTLMVEA